MELSASCWLEHWLFSLPSSVRLKGVSDSSHMHLNQDEIVSMIIAARDNGSATLSLHGKGVEVLPPEGQLASLVGLWASHVGLASNMVRR